MMEIKCMAWGPEYSKYFKNRSYYFIIISQKSAGCPCPLPFPGDLVKLGPNPDSMACENPVLFPPFWQIPTCHFSGRPETSLLLGWDVLPGTKPDPFRGSMINPLENSVLLASSHQLAPAPSRPRQVGAAGSLGGAQRGRGVLPAPPLHQALGSLATPLPPLDATAYLCPQAHASFCIFPGPQPLIFPLPSNPHTTTVGFLKQGFPFVKPCSEPRCPRIKYWHMSPCPFRIPGLWVSTPRRHLQLLKMPSQALVCPHPSPPHAPAHSPPLLWETQ